MCIYWDYEVMFREQYGIEPITGLTQYNINIERHTNRGRLPNPIKQTTPPPPKKKCVTHKYVISQERTKTKA